MLPEMVLFGIAIAATQGDLPIAIAVAGLRAGAHDAETACPGIGGSSGCSPVLGGIAHVSRQSLVLVLEHLHRREELLDVRHHPANPGLPHQRHAEHYSAD